MSRLNLKSIIPTAATIILFAVAGFISYANNSSTPQPHHENAARGQLWTLFQSCKMFWKTVGYEEECSFEVVSESPYTFSFESQDRIEEGGKVEVQLASGFKETFSATASHVESKVVWKADATGRVGCLQFSPEECERLTHFSHKEMIDEVRQWGGIVNDDATYIEIK